MITVLDTDEKKIRISRQEGKIVMQQLIEDKVTDEISITDNTAFQKVVCALVSKDKIILESPFNLARHLPKGTKLEHVDTPLTYGWYMCFPDGEVINLKIYNLCVHPEHQIDMSKYPQKNIEGNDIIYSKGE